MYGFTKTEKKKNEGTEKLLQNIKPFVTRPLSLFIFKRLTVTKWSVVIICQFTRSPEENENKEATSYTGYPSEAVQVH